MKLSSPWLTGCFAMALLSLSACTTSAAPAPAPAQQIVSTTSFGMCVGYCSTRLEISEDGAVLTRSARGGRGSANLPDQRFTATLSASEWQEMSRLASETRIDGLPARIGCPDCADGGAESLGLGERTITFDYGAPIAEAQPLLERVHALRARMMPAE